MDTEFILPPTNGQNCFRLQRASQEIHLAFILHLHREGRIIVAGQGPAEGGLLATPVSNVRTIYEDVLTNCVTSMARMVETSVGCALDALLRPNLERAAALSSQVFLVEPRVNEMEILIDDHAVRMLRTGLLDDEEIRRVVASQKIANDLERIGDLAVNISERVISLAGMNVTETPQELAPMSGAVRGMLGRSLGALIFRNVVLAGEVLESDDVVDRYRDQIFEHLLAGMIAEPSHTAPHMQFVLATRYLERIADHSTNIAEDIIFWVRGLDVRHGRARFIMEERNYPEKKSSAQR